MIYRINDDYQIEIFVMNGDQWRLWVDCYEGELNSCRSFTIEAIRGYMSGWKDLYGRERIPVADQQLIQAVVMRLWKMRVFI